MKKLIPIATILLTPADTFASKIYECNTAINNVAIQLKAQSKLNRKTAGVKNISRAQVETMLEISRKIKNESKRMIRLCKLNREMTESVSDLIINNTAIIEQLTQELKSMPQNTVR